MYFWNIKKLKAQLIEKPLSERETLPYLIAFLLSFVAAEYAPQPDHYNHWDYITILTVILLSIFGTYWLYLKNMGDSGSHFLQRYISLGWVVLIRLIVFAIPAIFLFLVIGGIFGFISENTTDTSWHDAAGTLLLEVFYLWYFGKHLAEVAEKAAYR